MEENRLPKIHTILNLTTNRRTQNRQVSGLSEKFNFAIIDVPSRDLLLEMVIAKAAGSG